MFLYVFDVQYKKVHKIFYVYSYFCIINTYLCIFNFNYVYACSINIFLISYNYNLYDKNNIKIHHTVVYFE